MRITASHIVEWASVQAKEAQSQLPLLVRRLCFDPEATRQISFPAGDSTYVPGWDGVLNSDRGNAWVPPGASRWEMGCDQNVTAKANKDYKKRTEKIAEEERLACSFVFVTPRRWMKKSVWVAGKRSKGEWGNVRAYDADDLEQWLEQTPAVALQFAEALGLGGWGVESLSRYWSSWSHQCNPAITFDALFMDRSSVHDSLSKQIQIVTSQSTQSHPLAIRADSVEEAVAFAVAVVIAAGLQDHALVVTEPEGWRYVEANPQLRIAIAARTETASNLVLRDGLLVIMPHATGDLLGKPSGEELILERPNIYEFEKALIGICMEESDAKRYALSTGRSWTVFRRQRAINPAIQRPAWLEAPQSASLTLLCLLGAWHADKAADRQVVEQLAARPYEEIERDLRQLMGIDDSPILNIGAVWKAKSPLELLDQFGEHITSDQLDRFFSIARGMLSLYDPQLDLPDEERWMAQVHGKTHPYSHLLFESVCDSLMKLAVRGPEQAGLQAMIIEERVAGLVRELLDGADGQRWLSLASYLPTLAEAAPNAFLRAVESSLLLPDAPITRLIKETSSSGFMGRCWHSGLLWALETLAWAPNRLARVALILAQLSHVPMKGNWGNKPSRSLYGLFRHWLPQTAAGLPERIKVLNLLIQRDEEASFPILEEIASNWPQMALQAARPKWREDDAGAGHGVSYGESYKMIAVAKEKLLQLSKGNATRIASILQNTSLKHHEELPKVLALIEPFTQSTSMDEDRNLLRKALSEIIYWHHNYDKSPAAELDKWLGTVEACYERLAPQDLVTRYRWLFDNYWPKLPNRDRDLNSLGRNNAITELRTLALTEVYQAQGMAGIEKMIAECTEPHIVGATLAAAIGDSISWPEWFVSKSKDFTPSTCMTFCLAGFLQHLSPVDSVPFLQKVIALGKQSKWDATKIAHFLVLAKPVRETWQLVETYGTEVCAAYWHNVHPIDILNENEEDLKYGLEQLLEAKRPMTALHFCQYFLKQAPAKLLFLALQQVLQSTEADGPMLDTWQVAEMLERLETSGEIEKMSLVQLEFGLFPALGYGQETRAAVLYESIMSEPQLFSELICLLYKPEHGEREESTEAMHSVTERAGNILHACKRLPGTQPDGSIDLPKFTQYIDKARELCREADRSTVGDRALGQILAHCPTDGDGTWPFHPVRELLERPELEEMRHGFCTGTFNKRGMTTRSPLDGGGQERNLAAYYRGLAERVQYTHPNVATMLEEIAKDYDHQGKREDTEANLRKEGF